MARILVLSQERAKAAVLALVLEFSGHRCEVAGSVTEAIEFLDGDFFDAVVADYARQDSLAKLAEYLRNASRKTAIVVLANAPKQARKGDRKIMLHACPPEQLLQAIDAIVRRKPARPQTATRAAAKAAAA